jgi:hypothetical protein
MLERKAKALEHLSNMRKVYGVHVYISLNVLTDYILGKTEQLPQAEYIFTDYEI